MLTIRLEQEQELELDARERFVARLAEHARRHFPPASSLEAEALPGLVRRIWERSNTLGFNTELGVYTFANACLALGEHFLEQPEWAFLERNLREDCLSEENKISATESAVQDHLEALEAASF